MNLNPRQKQFARDVASGLTQKQVAQKHGVHHQTVKNSLWLARRKTGLTTTQIAIMVSQEGKDERKE